MDHHQRGSPPASASASCCGAAEQGDQADLASVLPSIPRCGPHSDLERYTSIQAAFSAALAAWQRHWRAVTAESLAALAGHGIAISFRQSACGGYVATLLHEGGGGIDSGLCSSLEEAQHLVLGHSLEDPRP